MHYISEAFNAINRRSKLREGYEWEDTSHGDSYVADFKMKGNPVFAEVTADERGTMARIYKYKMKLNTQTWEKEPQGDPQIVAEQRFGDANPQNFNQAKSWVEKNIATKQESMNESYDEETVDMIIHNSDPKKVLQCSIDFISEHGEQIWTDWVNYLISSYKSGNL